MTEIAALEAAEQLGALLDRVQNGEEIVITRDGVPVARLTSSESAFAALTRIRARAEALRMHVDLETLHEERGLGRR